MERPHQSLHLHPRRYRRPPVPPQAPPRPCETKMQRGRLTAQATPARLRSPIPPRRASRRQAGADRCTRFPPSRCSPLPRHHRRPPRPPSSPAAPRLPRAPLASGLHCPARGGRRHGHGLRVHRRDAADRRLDDLDLWRASCRLAQARAHRHRARACPPVASRRPSVGRAAQASRLLTSERSGRAHSSEAARAEDKISPAGELAEMLGKVEAGKAACTAARNEFTLFSKISCRRH